jgi:hypothetical protein
MLRDCGADSVWPGDANADKIVDLYDPLAIALTYNDTGAARTSATTNWNAEYCDFWNGSFLNNIDKKHADCNGDGIVTSADLGAVALNYGKVHAKGPRRKTTAATELYFDHTGIDPNPDSTVSIKIMLGNSTNQVNGLYGLAANITVDGLSLATPPTITYSSSWLGNGTNTMSFTKEVSPTSTDWAYARTDKQNTSGQGQVANVEFKIPASTPGGTLVTLSFDKARFIDKDGLELQDIGILDDTFYVRHPATVKNINQNDWQVQIYPNPSGGTASLHVLSANRTDANITVKDITGKTISITNKLLETGRNTISLSGDMLAPGIYMVYISGTGHSGKAIKWVIH